MNLNNLVASLADTNLSEDTSKGAPVHLWSPSFCGDIPLTIHFDGTWTYQGTPIGRQKMVKLFASVLKKEDENYYLVTPVEKVGIKVVDVPFIVTQWQQNKSGIQVALQSGEQFMISQEHPVECRQCLPNSKEMVPYVLVRANLWARFHQNVFYQMIEQATSQQQGEINVVSIQSGDYNIELGRYR